MGNYDAWLEAPYQDSLRNGEAVEALEIQFQDSDEFQDFFENWQQDEMSEFLPLTKSVLDTYLGTSEYTELLDAYIEAQMTAEMERQAEWEEMMFSEDYAEETRKNFFARLRKKLGR
jgi:predicted solute-binding protein